MNNNTLKQRFTIDYTYDVYFTEGLFASENAVFRDFLTAGGRGSGQKMLFVVDEDVWKRHPGLQTQIRDYLGDPALPEMVDPMAIPGGELCKNDPARLAAIVRAVDRHGIDRHSYVVGIGGGAVLDLVGFAAAISHRGIRHIRVPTTVLSQNDSGVGVKNSVNHNGKKNFLGTFAPPVAVFNDFAFLKTLDDRSWRAGMAEAVKVALIKDPAFFGWIEENAAELPRRGSQAMRELIFRCAELHLAHIRSGDPFEMGSSRPLDFGHWSAHKLEQMTDFGLLHGEAVAIGMAIDVHYSHLIGNLDARESLRAIGLIARLGLPVYHPILDDARARTTLLGGLSEFREHLGGRLTVVLLEAIGRGRDYHSLDTALLLKSIDFLKNYHQNIRP